ncbi:hypothetical protein KL942_002084 [Ogataea angusta]|uniref:Transcription initiation factor TFIID subunit 8 n=1 Tax=Pichia angusta TaxID=870730 RepID=A0ABQ7RRD8_PICAN|nr:hypothetical protein KL942_002084 [Ogataea angusta]KAG7846132.1 hypothetical protein KL940_004719 [Ogataea angusta]
MAEETESSKAQEESGQQPESPNDDNVLDEQAVAALLKEIEDPRPSRMDLAKVVPIERVKFELEPMDMLLESCLGLMLAQIGIQHITRSALNQLTLLAIRHIDQVYSQLHRITEVQRRRQPGKADLRTLEKLGVIDYNSIYEAYLLTKKLDCQKLQNIDRRARRLCEILDKPAEDEIVTEQDPAFVFFNDTSSVISQVIPPSVGPKEYIPSWMPPLPPDHTYRATPKYTAVIEDPIKMREQLVQEARLGEKALHHILDLKDNVVPVEKGESEPELDTDVSSETEQKEVQENEEPELREGKFDIVALATKRLAALERRRQEKEKKYKERVESQEAVLGRVLGFYTKSSGYPEEFNNYIKTIYDQTYDQVVSGLRTQQKRRIKQVQQEKERRERMQEEIRIPEFGSDVHEEADFDIDDFELDEIMQDVEKEQSESKDDVVAEQSATPVESTRSEPAIEDSPSVVPDPAVDAISDEDVDMDLFE